MDEDKDKTLLGCPTSSSSARALEIPLAADFDPVEDDTYAVLPVTLIELRTMSVVLDRKELRRLLS
jgi:hypothetical protein